MEHMGNGSNDGAEIIVRHAHWLKGLHVRLSDDLRNMYTGVV